MVGNELRAAEASVRKFSEATRLATPAAVDIGTRALTNLGRELAASAVAMLKTADQGVRSADRIVAASPGQATALASDTLNHIMNNLGTTAASALRVIELSVSSTAGAVPAYGPTTLQHAQTLVQASMRSISGDADTALLAIPVRETQSGLANKARLMLANVAEQVGRIRATAEAMDPKTVISAGYAILRGMDGLPLTRVAAVTLAREISAELRDGSAMLKPYGKKVRQ